MNNLVEIKVRANNYDTDEARFGNELKSILQKSLPSIARGKIVIQCNATLFGQEVKDIDMVCLGQLENCSVDLYVGCEDTINESRQSVAIDSFVISIELKRHPVNRVKFEGTDLYVEYKQNGSIISYHCATEQANKQKIALRNFFMQTQRKNPYVCNSIWLSSVLPEELKQLLTLSSDGILKSNVLPSNFGFVDLMQIVADQMPAQRINGKIIFKAFNEIMSESLEPAFSFFETARKTQGQLTRRRIESISHKQGLSLNTTGERLNIIRGYAGTGKTISLLKNAIRLMEEENARVLILTYNQALVSDLRRTLAFMDIPDIYSEKSVKISTGHSFMHQWLIASGIIESHTDFLSDYETSLSQITEYLVENVLDQEEIARIKSLHFADLEWDFIFIDEAQDWLELERDVLYKLYGSEKIAIADGVDQLVRSGIRCDWAAPLRGSQKPHLEKCGFNLRQKNNLAEFVNNFAYISEMEQWHLKTLSSMPGGRIIVSLKPYLAIDLHRSLIEDLINNENSYYDMLFLVPPQLVKKSIEGHSFSLIDDFKKKGINIWDGTQRNIRIEYAVDLSMHRLLQYDSCRGLEGWTVICLDYDDFIEYKSKTFKETGKIDELALESPEWRRKKELFGWSMLPLTRAISNLVITIKNPQSEICSLLYELYQKSPDTIEWIV